MAARDLDQALRLDKDASKIALGYVEGLEDVAIMQAVAPQIKVVSNGKYPSYGTGAWYDQDDDLIGPGATQVNEFIPPAESWNAYVIETHAKKALLSNLETDSSGIAQGMVYSDKTVAAKKVAEALYQGYCKTVADFVVATGNSAAPGTAWDQAGATPFDNIQTWLKSMKDAIGVGGYTALTTDRVMWHLGEGCRTKYAHTGNMSNYEIVEKNVTRDLGLDRLLISRKAEYLSGSTFVSIWGNNFIMFKNQANIASFMPTYCVTMVPKEKQFVQVFKPYGAEVLDHLGQYVQVRMHYLVKELDSNAVYMGSSVIS